MPPILRLCCLLFSLCHSRRGPAFAVARSSLTHSKNRVISTGAAHSFIVSSAAEKPASLPTPLPSQDTRLCFSCLSSPQETCFCCCPFFSHPLQKPCHFDRSCSQLHREQRSGETRFSTNALPQPRHPPLLFLLVIPAGNLQQHQRDPTHASHWQTRRRYSHE